MRLSRKKKAALRRHAPLGVVNDEVVMQNPGRRWGRQSFIAEKGHSKFTWRHLWEIWNPGVPEGERGYRLTVTAEWFRRQGRQMPRVMPRQARLAQGLE